MKEAYIIKAYRTAVGKAPRGFFKFKRPDELAAETIEYMISQIPDFDKKLIDDLIVVMLCLKQNKVSMWQD